MPRIRININKTNLSKIESFVKKLKKANPQYGEWLGIEDDTFYKTWVDLMKEEIKSLKDCHEKSIIEGYISTALNKANTISSHSPISLYTACKEQTRMSLVKQYTDKTFDNNIDRYFNDVKKEYIMHPMNESDELIFCDENREVFLKNNLKLVVNCAKRYRGLGMPFEDLIQNGNEGLLLAFERFDASKASLRNVILQDVNDNYEDDQHITYDEAAETVRKGFTYDKLLDQTLAKLPKEGFNGKNEFIEWVKKNIKTAIFASVAFQWIRSLILVQLNKQGQVVRMPKSNKNGMFADIVHLDAINPYTDDCYHDNEISDIANEEFIAEDNRLEDEDKQQAYKEAVVEILECLTPLERRCIRKRFGINMPYALSISELAENERISLSTAKITLKTAQEKMVANITPNQREVLLELLNND